MYNPLYLWPQAMASLLVDKDAAKEPWMRTKWVESGKTVGSTWSRRTFSMWESAGSGIVGATVNNVDVDIFHWEHDKWFKRAPGRRGHRRAGGASGLRRICDQ